MATAQYNLTVHPEVQNQLTEINSKDRERITDTLTDIVSTRQPTEHPKCSMLTNAHREQLYKIRVGDYRCVAHFDKPEFRILKLGQRQSIYNDIDSLYDDL